MAAMATVPMVVACSSPSPAPADTTAAADPARALASAIEAPAEPAPTKAEVDDWSRASTGDLADIRARGTLRVLVPASRSTYVVEAGSQHGPSMSAGRQFERFLNAQGAAAVKAVFIPTPEDELVSALNEGRGDLAMNVPVAPDRDPPPAAIVPALTGVRELVVTGPGVPKLVSLEDVEGRRISVPRGGRHARTLEVLNGRLKQVAKGTAVLVPLEPSLSDDELLQRVNDGTVPATIVDSHIAAMWQPRLPQIAVNDEVSVSQDGVMAWAVRPSNPYLLTAVKAYAATLATGALMGR